MNEIILQVIIALIAIPLVLGAFIFVCDLIDGSFNSWAQSLFSPRQQTDPEDYQ